MASINTRFYYSYVLLSLKTNTLYAGSTQNLEARYQQHQSGQVTSTQHKRPLVLVYYEAILERKRALAREKYLKSGMGKRYLKNRLKRFLFLTGYNNDSSVNFGN